MQSIGEACGGILERLQRNAKNIERRCDACGEPLYQTFDVNIAGEMRQATTPRQCKCQRERMAAKKEHERLADIEVARDRALPSAQARQCRFETSDDSRILQSLKRYVDRWEEVKTEAGLMLWGGVGTGKSHAAYCIANALIDKGVSVYVTRISHLANTVFEQDKLAYKHAMDRVCGCALLILDDIGAERDSQFMYEKAFEFIDARIETGRPLIVTTNLTPSMMDDTTDLDKKRTFDRIRGATVPIEFKGESKRAAKAPENVARLREILR
jgi:DNA replication protein DnaC